MPERPGELEPVDVGHHHVGDHEVRRILAENFQAEEKIDADARTLLMDNAKLIRDSASDYKRLFALVKTKLAKERGFTL